MSQDAGRLLLGAAAPARFCVRGPTCFFLQPGAWEKGEETGMMNIDEHSQSTIKRRRTQELCFFFWIKRCQKNICPLMSIPNTSSFGNHRAEAMGTLARYRMVGANRYAIFGRKEL
jgi:hypothetical protein